MATTVTVTALTVLPAPEVGVPPPAADLTPLPELHQSPLPLPPVGRDGPSTRFLVQTEGEAGLNPITLGAAIRELIQATADRFIPGADDREFAYPPGKEVDPETQYLCDGVRIRVRYLLSQPKPEPAVVYRETFELRQAHNELVVDAAKACFRAAVAEARERSRFLPFSEVQVLQARTRVMEPGWHPDLSNRPDVYCSVAGAEQAVAMVETAMTTHDGDLGTDSATVSLLESVRAAEQHGRRVAAIEMLEVELARGRPVTDPGRLLTAIQTFLRRTQAESPAVIVSPRPAGLPRFQTDLPAATERVWQAVDRYRTEGPSVRHEMEQALLHLILPLRRLERANALREVRASRTA